MTPGKDDEAAGGAVPPDGDDAAAEDEGEGAGEGEEGAGEPEEEGPVVVEFEQPKDMTVPDGYSFEGAVVKYDPDGYVEDVKPILVPTTEE